MIRIPLPPLSEETRKGYIRQARQDAENARIAIRNIRRDALADIKELEKEKKSVRMMNVVLRMMFKS